MRAELFFLCSKFLLQKIISIFVAYLHREVRYLFFFLEIKFLITYIANLADLMTIGNE